MATVLWLVALLVALAGLLLTLGNAGYLTLLSSAANRRGLSGEATLDHVQAQRGTAGVLVLAALIGLACTAGGPVLDVLGLVLGGGSGVVGYRALQGTRQRFRGD